MTHDAPPPRMLTAPLRLTAMTLRGLGPYLHGARLEIKPLTILCGENGSGKSTWIEMLSKLKVTASHDCFPFMSLHSDDGSDETPFTRSCLHAHLLASGIDHGLSDEELSQIERERQTLSPIGDEDAYGPFGCITLELEVGIPPMSDEQPLPDGIPRSVATEFLWLGKLATGAKIRVRWANPVTAFGSDESAGNGLTSLIELQLNKWHVVRLGRKMDRIYDASRAMWNDKYPQWTFECSREFLGRGFGEPEVTLGLVEEQIVKTHGKVTEVRDTCGLDEDTVQTLCNLFTGLFRRIVQQTLDGFYHIGAIREIQRAEGTRTGPLDCDLAESYQEDDRAVEEQAHAEVRPDIRYVGNHGEKTLESYAWWSYNLMRQPDEPYSGRIDNRFTKDDFVCASRDEPTQLQLAEKYHTVFANMAGSDFASGLPPASLDEESWLKLLNHLLPNKNLYSFGHQLGLWPELTGEALALSAASDQLAPDEIERLNRLLIESVFCPMHLGRMCKHRTGYLFEGFVSYWMKQLTQAQTKYGGFKGRPLDEGWLQDAQPPNGGLVHGEKKWQPRGTDFDTTSGYRSLQFRYGELRQVIWVPTAGEYGPAHVMSTGFHQLAPIVVQAGLLRQNEIMAVENPEAHLHPSLQIKVAEFLMHQANAHKTMLIETHSDLIVRRIQRAIREGSFKKRQESVRTYFTRLQDGPPGTNFKYAVIEDLKINEQGQVANYPEGGGFMDDDLKEARRLIDAMCDDDLNVEGTDDE